MNLLRKLHYLDGLRGVAAAAVVIMHTDTFWGARFRLPGAYLAVDLFFVLSGIVLAHAYDSKFARGMTTATFMKIRLIRLYPLYALGCACALIPILVSAIYHGRFSAPWTVASVTIVSVFNFLFLPAPPGTGPTPQLFHFTDPAWSLFFELIINLLFALAWRWLTVQVLCLICAVGASLIVASSLAYGSLNYGFIWSDFPVGAARVLFSFPLGVLLYRFSRTSKPLAVSPVSLFVLFGILVWLPVPEHFRPIFDILAVLIIIPMACFVCAIAPGPRKGTALLNFLGVSSYAIYVLHRPLSYLAEGATNTLFHFSLHNYTPFSGFAFLCAMVCGAWFVDRFYDAPVRSWLMQYSRMNLTTEPLTVATSLQADKSSS